ncbi:hypothetical protein [Streptomyces platensis]|uniref:hypothetical protein n=1 Tax=Streptomyces platensis TaxID=58346 RepID=UPI0037BD1912
MTTARAALPPPTVTAVRYCEACWTKPVTQQRTTDGARLCGECAEAGYPRRVDQFPPLGIYGLTERKLVAAEMGRHGSGPPKLPPDPGPHLPSPPPAPSPPGTPPV